MNDDRRDLTKLPQWAQTRIRLLEQRVAALDAQLAAATGPEITTIPSERGVYFDSGLSGYRKMGSDRATFVLAPYAHIQARIVSDVVYGKWLLTIHGSRQVKLVPQASNAFNIELED